jgi:hypothetical protein|tara:strand:+ start:390 stop:578 length:189 start_codon:yes stop_codon:yes gene_type:complete
MTEINKEYLESEISSQKENYSKLMEQRVQVENAAQQTVGVINTLNVMLEKLNGKAEKKKNGK